MYVWLMERWIGGMSKIESEMFDPWNVGVGYVKLCVPVVLITCAMYSSDYIHIQPSRSHQVCIVYIWHFTLYYDLRLSILIRHYLISLNNHLQLIL